MVGCLNPEVQWYKRESESMSLGLNLSRRKLNHAVFHSVE